MGKNKLWLAGAILATVAIVGGGWVVGIAPQLASAASANTNRASVQLTNTRNQVLLSKLKNDYQNIGVLKKELSSLRLSVPTDTEISSFVTELNTLASTHQVTVKSISVSDAKPYTPVPSTGTSAQGKTVTPPASNPKITPANFVVIPVQFAVTGDYARVLDFIHDVQNGSRLYLVTTLSTTGSTNSKGVISNLTKSVASAPEKVDATIGGFIYVLLN